MLAAITAGIIVAAAIVNVILKRLVRHRPGEADPNRRYWATKLITGGLAAAVVIAVLIIWAPFGTRPTYVLALASAGIGFSMQH